jgi:hypothetical protein
MHNRHAGYLALAVLLMLLVSPSRLKGEATAPDACSSSPRVIVFDALAGKISWERCSQAVTSPLHHQESVQVRVEKVNPFRHVVNVDIKHTPFTELYTVPSSFAGNLFPSTKPTTQDQTIKNAAQAATGKLKAGGDAAINAAKALAIGLRDFQDDAGVLAIFDTFPDTVRQATLGPEDPEQVNTSLRDGARLLFKPSASASALLSDTELSIIRLKQEDLVDGDYSAFEIQAAAVAKPMPPEVAVLLATERSRFKIIDSTRQVRAAAFKAALQSYKQGTSSGFGTARPAAEAVGSDDDEISITIALPLRGEAANFDQAAQSALGTAADSTTGGGSGKGGGSASKSAATSAVASNPTITIPVLGGFRPSVSSGIFFSGLTSPSFFKDANGKASSGARDKFSTALGALVHTPFSTSNPAVSVALSLGVAIKDSNPVYVLGPSVILGRRQRTVLSVGISGGQVTRLSGIKLGDAVSGDQVPTAKVFRYGFYFGLSYNFGPTNTSSSKSSSSGQ